MAQELRQQERQAGKAKGPSVTRQTLRYFWWATRMHWPWFLGAVLSTIGFVFLLSYMNPYLMGLVIDLVSEGRVQPDQVFQTFGSIIVTLILVNIGGQVCSKLQDYFCSFEHT